MRETIKSALSDPLFHVVLAVAIICGIALAGNRSAWSQSRYGEYDRWGYYQPPECRRDLSHLKVKVDRTKNLNHTFGPPPAGGKRLGYWLASMIYIDRDLDKSLAADVLHHELCHQVWFDLTGSPHWHHDTN